MPSGQHGRGRAKGLAGRDRPFGRGRSSCTSWIRGSGTGQARSSEGREPDRRFTTFGADAHGFGARSKPRRRVRENSLIDRRDHIVVTSANLTPDERIRGHQQQLYTSRTEALRPATRASGNASAAKAKPPRWIRAFNKIARDAGTRQCRQPFMPREGVRVPPRSTSAQIVLFAK